MDTYGQGKSSLVEFISGSTDILTRGSINLLAEWAMQRMETDGNIGAQVYKTQESFEQVLQTLEGRQKSGPSKIGVKELRALKKRRACSAFRA